MRSGLLPPIGQANLSDNPPAERAPAGWPATFVPNFSEWKEGDVVLVQGGPWVISVAQLASRSRPNRVGRTFTHAGVYAGHGELIDATRFGGIQVRQVWTYAQTRSLALRRLPSISDQERLDIVAAARRHVGKSYGLWAAITSKLIPPSLLARRPRSTLYCSTLVAEAVVDGCGLQLDALPMYRPLYPATLSQHGAFDEVELEWRPKV